MRKFLFLTVAVLLTACGAASSSDYAPAAPQAVENAPPREDYSNSKGQAGITSESQLADSDYYGEAAVIKKSEKSEESEKKKIINASANIQTENYMADYEQIKNITFESGGYVESANSYSTKEADLSLRIPAQNYERAKNAIIAVGKLLSFTESAEDATQEYSDISLRSELKKTEETRVLAMIAEQPELSEKILLEQRLADIRAEIYYYDARIKAIDDLSAYSTIKIKLSQVAGVITETPRSFGERFTAAFKTSLASFANAIENILLFLAGNFFQLFIALFIIGMGWFIAKKTALVRRRRDS